jgi:hypothetical protein
VSAIFGGLFQSLDTYCLKIKVSLFLIIVNELYWQDILTLWGQKHPQHIGRFFADFPDCPSLSTAYFFSSLWVIKYCIFYTIDKASKNGE